MQRELAKQIYDQIDEWFACLFKAGRPLLRAALCIGGVDLKQQSGQVKGGVHCVVATPGRLMHMLENKIITLDVCRWEFES